MYNNRTKPGASVLIPLLVWLACAAYLGMNLKRGWVPWDEGILGQSAERVLNSEMPHRDFNEVYTGGLSYLNALVFRIFGINLVYLRYVLFGFSLLWVPAVYRLAREFLEPWTAGGVTLLAVAWSVPNYPAAMPSWFLLFFATFGTLALSTYINRPNMRWLILAGLCGGSSFLFKSVAIYFIAGGLLFLVFREQDLSRIGNARPHRTLTYVSFLIVCLTLFLLFLVKLVMFPGGVAEFLHFVLPSLVIAALLIGREREPTTVGSVQRFSNLLAMAAPFLGAAALPIILYFLLYWWHGALTPLMRALFVLAPRRVQYARWGPPGSILEFPSIFCLLIFSTIRGLHGEARAFVSGLALATGALLLFTSANSNFSYVIALFSLRGVVPIIVLILGILGLRRNSPANVWIEPHIFLLFSVTSVFSLIQFPYATPIYFCYMAPLAIVLLSGLVSHLQNPPRAVLLGAGIFYLCFATLIFRHQAMNNGFMPGELQDRTVRLTFPRAGNIRVSPQSSAQYEELIPFVTSVADGGLIVAGPDCPEVYFLAGLKNPTPFILEFLDTRNYRAEVQKLLNQPGFIRAIVINNNPAFSSFARDELVPLANEHFMESRKIGSFQVYWGTRSR
jgi:Dolichyl-phosphate-mannose-protein mannosyltransferase